MIKAYQEGKDLYATIASGVFHNGYWDNMEHHEDGTPNPEGKKRRGSCKSLLLGITYSRGVASIAEQIHGTKEEAQEIVDNFYKSFPKVKDTIDESHVMGKNLGYVEDFWGRRRRLPDIQLPRYEIIDHNESASEFNPFLVCDDRKQESETVKKYRRDLYGAKSWKERNMIIANAKKHNLEIRDNNSFIAQAERQCLNARIQGSAATMTKIAMIKLFQDEELNKLGFKLLIGVHDELIGECPKENQEAVAERLTFIMKTCVQDSVPVPFKCDADICDHWYYNDYCDVLKSEYEDYKKMGLGNDAKYRIYKEHTEMTHEQLDNILAE